MNYYKRENRLVWHIERKSYLPSGTRRMYCGVSFDTANLNWPQEQKILHAEDVGDGRVCKLCTKHLAAENARGNGTKARNAY